jgi:predicted permease
MTHLFQDLRHSARLARRSPWTVVLAVLSLGLGIGANTAIFSFVNAVQFRPLPVAEEDRLVDVSETSATELCAGCGVGTSYPSFLDWKASARSFDAMEAFRETRVVVSGGAGPERIGGAVVSSGALGLIGVRPALGRELTVEDDALAARPVVLISDMLWRRRFAANSSVLGRPMKIDGVEHTIIGVMPNGFRFPEYAQLWIPLAPSAKGWIRTDRSLSVVARLRPGVSIDQARAEMRTLASALEARYPESNRRWSAAVVTLREDMTAETAQASIVLLSAVAFVLLIACANVANLLLVRGVERRRELAIRAALGAGRFRLSRLLVVEGMVLAVAGGTLGGLLTIWASRAIVAAIGMEAPYWIHFGIDWRVLAFGVVVTLVTGILCSLPPAWQSWRSDPNATLKSGGSIAGGVAGTRFRATLVTGQLALSLLLLAGADLLIKTVVRTYTFIVDYDASRVLTADVELADRRYEQETQVRAFVTNVLERLGRIPSTQAAVLRPVFYAGFGGRPRTMEVEGSRYVPAGASPEFYYAVTPHYFAVFGAPVREGRAFSDADGKYVAIVNQELARRVWPGTSALGQRIRFGDASSRTPWLTVVGVVSDGAGTVFSTRQAPAAYVPFAGFPGRSISIQMSTIGDPGPLVPELPAAVADVDPDQPIEDVMTMEQAMARWRQPARFVALLMGSLAAVALLMASMGTFGVIAYSVSQRTREIGVRLALGASPLQVEALVARTGLRMTAAGLALGLPAAWVSTRALQGVLPGTNPTDPVVFAAVTATLSIVALAASWLPARRAGKVDPMVVLRGE